MAKTHPRSFYNRPTLTVARELIGFRLLSRQPNDVGCGDGIVTSAIAEIDPRVAATLVDGSPDMLTKARQRLKRLRHTQYIRLSFQEMLRREVVHGPFDFIASSLAIHHLPFIEKAALFEKIFGLLKPGGYFVNIDVVLAPTGPLEQWYLSLWKDWIDERAWDLGMQDDRLNSIIRQYKDADENKPDTLGRQVNALQQIGFTDVDCFYKQGIFSIYGAKKPVKANKKENHI